MLWSNPMCRLAIDIACVLGSCAAGESRDACDFACTPSALYTPVSGPALTYRPPLAVSVTTLAVLMYESCGKFASRYLLPSDWIWPWFGFSPML